MLRILNRTVAEKLTAWKTRRILWPGEPTVLKPRFKNKKFAFWINDGLVITKPTRVIKYPIGVLKDYPSVHESHVFKLRESKQKHSTHTNLGAGLILTRGFSCARFD